MPCARAKCHGVQISLVVTLIALTGVARIYALKRSRTDTRNPPTYTQCRAVCAADEGGGGLAEHAHVWSLGSQTRQCMGVLVCFRYRSQRAADFHTRTLVLI